MTKNEIIALVVTIVSLVSFSLVFTILFRHYVKGVVDSVKEGHKDIELLDESLARKKNKKKSKVGSIVSNVILDVVLVGLLFIFGVQIYSGTSGNYTPFGSTVLSVKTGSMSKKNEANQYLFDLNLDDQFQVYDMLVINKVEKKDLKKYDIIAFKTEELGIVIHRIVSDDPVNSDYFDTRGDALDQNDGLKPTFDKVIGRYEGKKIPIIGMFVLFFQSYSGLITAISVFYCIFMFEYYYKKMARAMDEREETLLKLIDNSFNKGDVKSSFKQYIYYKDNVFEFQDGIYKSKHESKTNKDEDTIYIVNSKDNTREVIAKDKADLQNKEITTSKQEEIINSNKEDERRIEENEK